MLKNENVEPRELSEEEKRERQEEVFDSFANYLSFCPNCGYVDKTNMYLMRAESRIKKLHDTGEKCPVCGKCIWELGYPAKTRTGFVDFE